MEVRVPSWPTVLERREGFDNDESTMTIEGALFSDFVSPVSYELLLLGSDGNFGETFRISATEKF